MCGQDQEPFDSVLDSKGEGPMQLELGQKGPKRGGHSSSGALRTLELQETQRCHAERTQGEKGNWEGKGLELGLGRGLGHSPLTVPCSHISLGLLTIARLPLLSPACCRLARGHLHGRGPHTTHRLVQLSLRHLSSSGKENV